MAPQTEHRSRDSNDALRDTRPETRPLSDDELFHLLQTHRRRETILYLLRTGGPVRMPELVRHVAATECGTSTEEVTREQYQRVYIPLYQSHLPKLDESGVVEYEKSRGIVRPTDRLETFRPYVEPIADEGARPAATSAASGDGDASDWYIAAAGLSSLLLVVGAIELVSLPGVVLGGLIVVAFLLANVAATR